MESRETLSLTNFEYLLDLLDLLNRYDLVKCIQEFQNKLKDFIPEGNCLFVIFLDIFV